MLQKTKVGCGWWLLQQQVKLLPVAQNQLNKVNLDFQLSAPSVMKLV